MKIKKGDNPPHYVIEQHCGSKVTTLSVWETTDDEVKETISRVQKDINTLAKKTIVITKFEGKKKKHLLAKTIYSNEDLLLLFGLYCK